jgi:succinoglycan biosynthesis transport protein ExoP
MNYSEKKNLPAEIRRIVWTRKLLIAAVFSLVVISGAVATFLITPKYEAQMSVIVARQRVDPQISPGEKSADVLLSGISDEEFNSELELLKNTEVLVGTAETLNLITDQAPLQDGAASRLRQRIKTFWTNIFASGETNEVPKKDEFALEKIAGRMANNLDVEPVKKSRIIKIAYTDTDPARAKRTLEMIYQKYIELHVKMSEKSPVTTVFDDQSNQFDRKLRKTTDAVKSFDRSNGVTGVEINSQSEMLLKQFYDTQGQAEQARTEIDETVQRIGALKAQVATQPQQIQTGSVSKYVGALDGMKNELIQMNQERTRLLQKYKPNARFVIEIEDRIKNLERSIAAETANPPQEKSFALNDFRRRLESDLATAQISLAALKTRERELTALAERQRTEAARLNIKSIERDQLERERKINEDAYLLYEKKARESEVGEVLNRQQILNVGVADPPRTDGEKKSPKTMLNLIVLIGLGAFAGFAAALAADKLSAKSDSEENIYGLPSFFSPPIKRVNHVPQLGETAKVLSAGSRKKSKSSAIVPYANQTFVLDGEDEKLSEIANFYNGGKQISINEGDRN